MNTKMEPQLYRRLQAAPAASFRLIVRLSGDLGARAEELAARGLTVYRHLALISALAVIATGAEALALNEQPWVIKIEEDRQVHACTGEHGVG